MTTKTRQKTDLLQPGGELELVAISEVAEILGVPTSNVPRMSRNPVNPLPDPVITYLKRGDLWLRSEIERFASERAGRLGREGPG